MSPVPKMGSRQVVTTGTVLVFHLEPFCPDRRKDEVTVVEGIVKRNLL